MAIAIPILMIPMKRSVSFRRKSDSKTFHFRKKKKKSFPFEISVTLKQIFNLRLNFVFGGHKQDLVCQKMPKSHKWSRFSPVRTTWKIDFLPLPIKQEISDYDDDFWI
jgi:hypothetical protein